MRSGLITHPDKVLFPERGETKADLAEEADCAALERRLSALNPSP